MENGKIALGPQCPGMPGAEKDFDIKALGTCHANTRSRRTWLYLKTDCICVCQRYRRHQGKDRHQKATALDCHARFPTAEALAERVPKRCPNNQIALDTLRKRGVRPTGFETTWKAVASRLNLDWQAKARMRKSGHPEVEGAGRSADLHMCGRTDERPTMSDTIRFSSAQPQE